MTFLEVVGDLLIFLHTPRHVRVNVPVIFSLPLAAVTGTMTLIKATLVELKVRVEPPCLHHFDFVKLRNFADHALVTQLLAPNS